MFVDYIKSILGLTIVLRDHGSLSWCEGTLGQILYIGFISDNTIVQSYNVTKIMVWLVASQCRTVLYCKGHKFLLRCSIKAKLDMLKR